MTKNYFCLIISFLSAFCFAQEKTVPFNSPFITYEGRIQFKADAAVLTWPGNSATIQFKGTEISARLKDLDTANYYNVIVDNQVIGRIHTDTLKHSYVLASGLSKGKHILQLFKRTEWDKGKTLFYGFEIPKNVKLLPPPAPKKRKIEFYGNSITCGYAMEDHSGKDSWFGYYENNYLSYAAITARHFNAQYYCNSKSGIGILISWFPLVMREMYDRLDPVDSTSKWDFTKYTPDIVVINLFQNDSWLVNQPERAEFKKNFGVKAPDENQIIAAYRNFVASIRSKYPQASIICALGSMDATRNGSPWPGYISKAVEQLHDSKIFTHFFPYKNTSGHPNVAEQKVMADSLIDFIEKNIKW
ncbi:MAG: SGNH/GDSL hydrolase family protein [Bacteroidota bacterium]|nr:SGNH/GDSL hydrolase family protein [Bacteroidota bacterium]